MNNTSLRIRMYDPGLEPTVPLTGRDGVVPPGGGGLCGLGSALFLCGVVLGVWSWVRSCWQQAGFATPFLLEGDHVVSLGSCERRWGERKPSSAQGGEIAGSGLDQLS